MTRHSLGIANHSTMGERGQKLRKIMGRHTCLNIFNLMQCKNGSTVCIRVGGDFFLDTDAPQMVGKNILLVAGGVGINPLASIVAQLQDYRKDTGNCISKTFLMFSAKTKAELLFSVIVKLVETNCRLKQNNNLWNFLLNEDSVKSTEHRAINSTLYLF